MYNCTRNKKRSDPFLDFETADSALSSQICVMNIVLHQIAKRFSFAKKPSTYDRPSCNTAVILDFILLAPKSDMTWRQLCYTKCPYDYRTVHKSFRQRTSDNIFRYAYMIVYKLYAVNKRHKYHCVDSTYIKHMRSTPLKFFVFVFVNKNAMNLQAKEMEWNGANRCRPPLRMQRDGGIADHTLIFLFGSVRLGSTATRHPLVRPRRDECDADAGIHGRFVSHCMVSLLQPHKI